MEYNSVDSIIYEGDKTAGLYQRAALNAEIDVEDSRIGRECGAAVFEEGETYEVVARDDEFGFALVDRKSVV